MPPAGHPLSRLLAMPLLLLTLAGASALDGTHHAHGTMQMEGPAAPAASAQAAFLHENDAAMERMMGAMAITPSGDVDRDFVAMMIPHHQGAIDMAQAVLRHGRNEQLRRLAQEIIVTQQQEIAAMRLAIGDPLPVAQAAPTQVPPASAD